MKFRNTLILLGVAIILIIFVYVFEIRKPEGNSSKSKSLGKTLLLENGDISKVELVYADSQYESIVCSKDNSGQWRITQPLKAKADQKVIDRMISRSLGRNVLNALKDPESLADYGLDNPRVEATFHLGDGASRTILLGNTVPTGNYVYVKQESAPDIYLVPASIVDDLTKFVSDLRDRTVIALDGTSVRRIRLEYADGKSVVCERKESGWELTEPVVARADASAVEWLISGLSDMKVDRFVDDPAEFSFPPNMKIFIVSENEPVEKSVTISQEKDGLVYVKTDSGEFLVNAEVADKLPKQPYDLRDRTVMVFDESAVEKVELKYPRLSIALEKNPAGEEEEWKMTAPMQVKADKSQVDGILRKLHDLRASEFAPDSASHGLAQPEIQITLSLKGSGTKTLLAGKKTGKLVYVKTAAEETVYLVGAGILDDLTKKPLDFRNSQMMEFQRDDVKRIELRKKDGVIVCIKQERDWRIIEPIREKASNDKVIDILRKLDSLKAEKFVAEKAQRLSEYGLDQPRVEVILTLKDDSTKSLLVGKKPPNSDSSYAKTAAEDVIFVIEKSVVDELSKKLDEIREEI